jgi:hypothetical protein
VDQSLTIHPALEAQAVPVVLGLVDLVDLMGPAGLVVVRPHLGLVVREGRVVLVLVAQADLVDLVDLMGPAGLVVVRPHLGLVVREGRVVLALVAQADLVDLTDRTAQADRDRMAPVDRAALAVLDRVDPVDLMDRTGLVVLAARVVLMARVVPADRAGLNMVVPADRAGLNTAVPADRAGLNTAVPAVLMGRVVLGDLVVPGDLNTAGRVAPAGHHRRPMCNAVTMTVVARSGVVRGTHRTASARLVTARPRLRPRTDSGGMVGLLPERRRPTGTVHRLLAVGTGRRPPEAGTNTGTDRHTISVGGRRTTARSTTTATTPHRSSIRCSVAGASGSSVRGSRCTDLNPA